VLRITGKSKASIVPSFKFQVPGEIQNLRTWIPAFAGMRSIDHGGKVKGERGKERLRTNKILLQVID